ncbi:hypothetical protein [Pseudoalteromonas sp. JC3]|uniref:hypothetical protein n=1 Tax=Pseudoalteromonas sp. JC3 TaxID=2810196 RepID=UPI0019D0BD68|nr:hypothetical protein [Pseudoalteromonas sp. JC3]MBR8845478.1 hypothetical protein [Pseudoalteromonas sp. JC3]WJE09245.1 hypothetical protein QSH61_01900 [Pseudoalteromonas sp. JC3]
MISLYKKVLSEQPENLSDTEKVTFYSSVLRSILQVVTLTSLERCYRSLPENEIDIEASLNRMQQPSDGLPVEIIESILPSMRTYIDRNLAQGWYKEGKYSRGLGAQLIEWVQFRNDTVGHSVLCEKSASEWSGVCLEIVNQCLKVFNGLMPHYDKKNEQLTLDGNIVHFPFVNLQLPLVVRKIVCNKGIWKLHGRQLSRVNANKVVLELDDECIYASSVQSNVDSYNYSDFICLKDSEEQHSILHNIPRRQTDIFEGRKKELSKLSEWLTDDDERACLVFGDGGFGKTTLVLEFLNRLLEDKIDIVKPRPYVISFYSAKMTRWTDYGLIHLKSVAGAMDECIRELIRGFEPVLTKDWYEVSNDRLIQKAVNYLREMGLDRNDVLFVFDNTETIATSTNEVEALGEFLQSVSKKIGKMIVTSRRREFINATPISVKGLDEDESTTLLTRQAENFEATPLLQAGPNTLKKVSSQLMYKPLLINSLVKHISLTNCSINAALESLLKKSSGELLEFLYEDAWARMSYNQQRVYLLLVQAESPLDHFSVSEACKMMSIPLTEFHITFDETYFGSLMNHGEKFSIELEELATKFFNKKINDLPEKQKAKLAATADELDIEVNRFHKIESEFKSDRIVDAFRSSFAKAARTHVRKKEYPEALEMYQMALEEEPLNSALMDRFAWFLYHTISTSESKVKAEALWRDAIRINTSNCDALVNLALIRYRENDLEEGDKLLDKARGLSRSFSFCALNKAKARFYYWKRNKRYSDSKSRLLESAQLIEEARKNLDKNDPYYRKTRHDIETFNMMLNKIASQETKNLAPVK